jgi:hypothetical protein
MLERDQNQEIGVSKPLPEIVGELRVSLLDSYVHLLDGQLPACGAAYVAHAGESNTTEHLVDVTCGDCRDLGEERAWERAEEAKAGAMTDAEVDRYIEDRRLR